MAAPAITSVTTPTSQIICTRRALSRGVDRRDPRVRLLLFTVDLQGERRGLCGGGVGVEGVPQLRPGRAGSVGAGVQVVLIERPLVEHAPALVLRAVQADHRPLPGL